MSLPPLVYIAAISVVLPFAVGVGFLPRLAGNVRPLVALLGIHSATTVTQFILAFQGMNNLWTSHLYNIVEVVFLLSIFSLWAPSGRVKVFFRVILVLYAVFWTLSKLFLERFDLPAVFTPTVSRIILISGALYILVSIASDSRIPLFREPKFWFSAGFLMACAGSLMFYGFRGLISDLPMESINRVWSIHWSVLTVSNLMLTIGFLCKPQARSSGGRLELAQ